MFFQQTDRIYFNNASIIKTYQGNNLLYDLTASLVPTIFALGGTITEFTSAGNTYRVHSFTSSDTLTLFVPTLSVDYLIVAGGGGSSWDTAGGGGAGGLLTGTTLLTGNTTVTVGSGGSAGISSGTVHAQSGGNSIFNNIVAVGGGRGGKFTNSPASPRTGGSGGGGGSINEAGAAGTTGQGFSGGQGGASTGQGGGGGGAGNAGGSGVSNGGTGGIGLSSNITGIATYYAGGGAGGSTIGILSGGRGGGGTGHIRGTTYSLTIPGSAFHRTNNLVNVYNTHNFTNRDFGSFTSATAQNSAFTSANNTPTNAGFEITVVSPTQFQFTTTTSGSLTGSGNVTVTRSTAQNGVNSLGGGAGGTGDAEATGRRGGSGVVIVRYKI